MTDVPLGEGPAGDPIGFIRAPTPQLRAFVAEQRRSMPEGDFAEMMVQIRGLFTKYATALEVTPPGAERARLLHRMMETAVATASGVAVSCRVGCCGCCHFEVEVTQDEGELLRDRVLGGVSVDRDLVRIQASRERKSLDWVKFWNPENRCVFLDAAGSCRIYEDRPSACRRLLVTTPAEACTTQGAEIAPVRMLLAEILLSAAIGIDPSGLSSISKKLARLLPA